MAQNEVDAFRYLSNGTTGTARAIGAGGAFSAVGADFTAASLNPAGLALYRRSDLMFTPRLRTVNNETSYLDVVQDATKSKFGFANVGYVSAGRITHWNRETLMREEADKGLKSYAFSIGFNQIANYSRRTNVSAYNRQNSITDYFASFAEGTPVGTITTTPGYGGAAYLSGLIDTSGVDGHYIGAAIGGQMQQEFELVESGRHNEWTVGLAGNIDDRIYAGFSLGIQDIKYSQEWYHTEEDINNVHQTWANDSTPLAGLEFTDIYETGGTGINMKMGVILRPSDMFRVGVAFQTPTWISLNDDYVSEITGNIDQDPNDYGRDPESGTFSYSMTTPFKATLGAMLLFKKLGFLSADFEYIDYSATEYKSRGGSTGAGFYSFQTENQAIRQLFDAAYNFRIGGELRFGYGRARAGYALNGAVLKDDYLNYIDFNTGDTQKLNGSRHIFSGGLGIKQESYYLDIAYARELYADRRLYYTVQDPNAYSPELIRRNTAGNIYMTIGFTF